MEFILASYHNKFQEILPKFTSPLKTNFENYDLWLRFGLTLALSRRSPSSALQAYIECMRINQDDPLPAMLAAKLALEDLHDPERGLSLVRAAIDRCSQPDRLLTNCYYKNIAPLLSKCYLLASVMHAHLKEQKPESIRVFDTLMLTTATTTATATSTTTNTSTATTAAQQLTQKQSLEEGEEEDSQRFLDLAREAHESHLVYFHKALHEAKRRSYKTAIDNLHRAIKLNPHHLPTVQLLILSLSAIKMPHDALVLCESTLLEFQDNLLLLYVKCNLEQHLVETRGYKSALTTARHIMKCMKQVSSADGGFSRGTSSTTTATIGNSTIANHNTTVTTTATVTPATTAANATTTTTAPSTAATTATTTTATTLTTTTANSNTVNHSSSASQHPPASPEKKESSANLFADDVTDRIERAEQPITDELSVWLLVAEIFIKIGSIDDAESCVDEGSMFANGALSHRVMFVRGLIAKAKNNLIEAKAFFQSCLALCPRHAKALQQLAHVHYLLGNYSTAEKFLRDSIEIDSSCSKSWDYLRLVLIEQNQLDRAKKCEQEFEALSESSPVIPISAISRLTLI